MNRTRLTAHTVTPGRVEVYKPGEVMIDISPADARDLADDLMVAAARAARAQREEWAALATKEPA